MQHIRRIVSSLRNISFRENDILLEHVLFRIFFQPMVEGGRKGGGLIHFGATDIFILIAILQLKANKRREQICNSELEVQSLSQSNTDSNIISTYKLKRIAHY
jgi:hypothetical protein